MFPWDTLADVTAPARAHPDGIVDLSVGTPVDEVAPVIRDALAAASAAPGYPTTAGTPALRASAVAALHRRYGITGLAEQAVLPVIGTKELIAWLPTLLGLGADDLVVVPELAYPTYDVGARLAGAPVLPADSLTQLGPQSPALVFINSPSNPTGKVLGVDHLRKVVDWARERGALVVSDECYLGLGWEARADLGAASLGLRRRPHRAAGGALAVEELVAGGVSRRVRRRRPRCGRRAAGGAQARRDDGADAGAGGDGRRARRRRPRTRTAAALCAPPRCPACRDAVGGFTVDHSEAGLYLWATRGEPCRDTLAWLAERGILVAPGEFYGPGRCAARSGGSDRDRRADRRRGATTYGIGLPQPVPLAPARPASGRVVVHAAMS